MRAAVYKGIGQMDLLDVPVPKPGPGEALLRVGAVGICATDVRIFGKGHHRIPAGSLRVLGHELAGEVVQVGPGLDRLSPGMRVGVAPNVGCGECAECIAGWTNLCPDYQAFGISLDGAFAEYMLITSKAIEQGNVMPIPAQTSFAVAALAEPLSCCLNAQEAVDVCPDDLVLIIGAGPIGLMHLLLARLRGARLTVVSEISEARLAQARSYGPDLLVDPTKQSLKPVLLDASEGRGADVIIVAVGSAGAQQEALSLAAPRGRVVFFGGLPQGQPNASLDTNLIHYRQLTVTGTTGATVRQYRAAMRTLVEGRIPSTGLVSAVLPLDHVVEGLERTKQGTEMRILLDPTLA